jgi:hypothetical protein
MFAQQYDVYVEYRYVGGISPYNGNVYVGVGNIITLNEYFQTPYSPPSSFTRGAILSNTTTNSSLTWNANLNFDTFNGIDNGTVSLGPTGKSQFYIYGQGSSWSGSISLMERITLTAPSDPICFKDKISIQASIGHPSNAYTWFYSAPGYPEQQLLGNFSSQIISLEDLYPNPNDQIDLINKAIQFRLYNSLNDYSVLTTYAWKGCSAPLLDVQTTNTTCPNDNDGSLTLTFGSNIALNNQMWYYIYQGPYPTTTPTTSELENINPPQAFRQPVLNSLIDNGNGTFSGSTPMDMDAGEYYVIYQERNNNTVLSGGITQNTYFIEKPSEIQISIPPQNVIQPSCFGETGSVTINGLGGGFPPNENITLEYGIQGVDDSWNSNPTFSNLEPGNYIFIARSPSCVSSPSEQITITSPPELSLNNPSPGITSSSSASDGIISIFYDGGTPNYTFELANENESTLAFEPVINPNFNHDTLNQKIEFRDLGFGTFKITIIDSNNCNITSENIAVTTIPPPQIIDQQVNQIACPNGNEGSINLTISGGVLNYNYQWTINGLISPVQTTGSQTISLNNIAEPGEYILKVASTGFTDFNDPTGYVSTTITLNAPEEVIITSATPNNISCFGAQDGGILVTASGGFNYEYKLDFFGTWTPLNNGTIPITSGGFYDVYLRNQNNCESDPVMGILVSEPDELTVSSTSENATTNGGNQGSITLSIAGGTQLLPPADLYTITWTKDNQPFTPAPGSTGTNLINLEAGEYIAQITDANGCSPPISPTITITQPGQLAISNIIPTDVDCYGQTNGSITTTVIGQGNITSEWTMSDGSPILRSDGINSPNISGIAAGSYMLTVSDGITTIVSEPILISEPATALELTNIIITNANCFGSNDGSLEIEVIGGTAPYTYSLDGTNYQNFNTYNNLPAGNYTIYLRDNNGCELTSNTVLLDQPQELILTIDEQRLLSAANASDGAIYITASGGTGNLTYSWTGPNGFTSTQEDVVDLPTGDYILTITDENYVINNGLGCMMVSSPITISEPGALLVDLVQTVMLECNGNDFGEITANVQGGVPPYAYEWYQTVNGNNIALDEYTEIIGNLTAGEYFVRVTDANSITTEALAVSITEPNILEISINDVTDVLCNGGATGAITVSISGGTGPYSYLWSNGSNNQNLMDLEAGEYTLEVYDDNGCFAETIVTIDAAPDAVRIVDAEISNNSQYMANDGSISLQIEGGATPYAITWIRLSDNMSIGNSQEITNLSKDTYQATIMDANGCSATETYTITEPDIVEETITQPSCSGQNDGSIEVVVNQGNGIYTYTWDNGATSSYITNLAPGNYSITINGFGDGPLTRTYVLEEQMPLEVDLGEDRTLCAGQELVLDAAIINDIATYSWTSDNGFISSEPTVVVNESGNYTVTISNQNGCTATDSIFVDVTDNEINAEFAVSSQVFVGESLIAVDISYPLPETQQWILPEGATVLKQDSDEAELVFTAPGEYEISIITHIGECWAQQTKKVLVMEKDALTLEDGENDPRKLIEDFIIYPNPTSGEFVADINLSERGNISIKIFNFANNALMASEKARGESSYSLPFDISGLPSGVYAVVLETPFGNSLRKVILK